MSRAFVLIFILGFYRLLAQTASNAVLLSTQQGLSQGMVFDVLQSRDGFLWIATKDGLNRYDGYRFEVFSNDPFKPFSLASNEIWSLYEDSRGRIWIVFADGMDVFVPESGYFFHLNRQRLPAFRWDSATFAEADDGTLWLTGNGRIWTVQIPPGLLEEAADRGNAFPEFKIRQIDPAGSTPTFSSIFFSSKKELLACNGFGLYQLDTANGNARLLRPTDVPLYILGEDRSGQIWLESLKVTNGTSEAIWVWKPAGGQLKKFPGTSNYSGLDYDGFLWMLDKNVLRKWHPEAFEKGEKPEFEWINREPFIQYLQYRQSALAFDRSGIAWVGANGFGVFRINPAPSKFASYLPATSQRMIMEDSRGRLFTAMRPDQRYTSSRFDYSEPNRWFRTHAGSFTQAYVFDASGTYWCRFGKDTLFRFDPDIGTNRHFACRGLGLIRHKNEKFYSVSEQGLTEFDPGTEQVRYHAFDRKPKLHDIFFSHFLYGGKTDPIWIFALEGLIKAIPNGQAFRFEYYTNNPADRASLSNNLVLCVQEDPLEPERFLWVGTKGGGLNRLDIQTGTFKHYKTEQGLPDNVIYGILPDNSGHIWLSTNRGLCRFHVREETVNNFTMADGLQDNEFNRSSYLKTRDGTLIFGGVNGLSVFHPDSLRFNEHRPQTHIVAVFANNERQGAYFTPAAGKRIPLTLTHQQNFLTLEFAALEFTNPARNRYRYRLTRHAAFGPDPEEPWVELGEKNSVQFANLPPGRYTFSVLGSNNDGLWSEEPALLEFVIRPPWWASWWAYLFYLGTAASAVWLYYRYQLRRRLEHQETLRLRELDNFKNRFFTNITHEFRTPLTIILGMTERLLSDRVILSHPVTHVQPLTLIRRNGENLLRLINQLLDLARLESGSMKMNYVQGNVVPYLRYIAESLHSLANAQNVMLRVETAPQTSGQIVMDYDPERLLQIVHNLLSNAIKFTPSGGKVTLFVRQEDAGIVLEVADTGAGIPPEDLPHIFDRFYQANNLEKAKAGGTGIGLALTRELVQAMGGSIVAESQPGRGATFTVRLPVTRQAPAGSPPPVKNGDLTPAVTGNIQANASPLPAGEPSGARLRILLVEDNSDVVEYLVACLQDRYLLDFAYNGRAGLEKALEIIPDLVISDVMMPEKDGFEVCETLKNDERSSHIPVVLLTAKAGVENRIAGLRHGADAYLAKPFHQEELLATIENLLELRKKLQAKYQDLPLPTATAASPRLPDPEAAFLQKVQQAVVDRLSDSSFTVDDLCRTLAMSQPQLHRKLTALTGKNATLFIRSVRLAWAKEMLLAGEKNVGEVAFAVGFDDPKYFSRVFAETFGIPPSKI